MPDSFVDASEIFERVKRKAEAEQADPFTMDPEKGLSVKVVTGSGKKERTKILWISAPFEIVGRVRLAAEVTASHYTSSGTLEEWQNSVAKLAEAHSRARFAVASAFASPLLALIGADGG